MGASTPGSVGSAPLPSPESGASSHWTRSDGGGGGDDDDDDEQLSAGRGTAAGDGGEGDRDEDDDESSVARLAKRLEFLPARVSCKHRAGWVLGWLGWGGMGLAYNSRFCSLRRCLPLSVSELFRYLGRFFSALFLFNFSRWSRIVSCKPKEWHQNGAGTSRVHHFVDKGF